MKKWILKFYENDVIRYIFWGGCTTLVNLLSFYIMRANRIARMIDMMLALISGIPIAHMI